MGVVNINPGISSVDMVLVAFKSSFVGIAVVFEGLPFFLVDCDIAKHFCQTKIYERFTGGSLTFKSAKNEIGA